jgi:hypothetical protein
LLTEPFQTPHIHLPKLFGELRNRYLTREGGYTRVVRTEPKNVYDQGESAILEFVDGPKDSRFMMTAKTVARDRMLGRERTPITDRSVQKLTRFRGEGPFETMVQRFMRLSTGGSAPAQESSNAEAEAAELAGEESVAARDALDKVTSAPTKKPRWKDQAPPS